MEREMRKESEVILKRQGEIENLERKLEFLLNRARGLEVKDRLPIYEQIKSHSVKYKELTGHYYRVMY